MIDAAKLAWVRAKIEETRQGFALRADTAKTLQILEKVFTQLPAEAYSRPVLFLLDGVGSDIAALAKKFDLIVVQASKLNIPAEYRPLLKSTAKHFGAIVIDNTINMKSDIEKRNSLFSIARVHEVESRLPDFTGMVLALRQLNPTGFGILTDQNVPKQLAFRLQKEGFLVARITKSKQTNASDNVIARLAIENELVIVTADTDFLNPELHDLKKLPGVILVPGTNLIGELPEQKRDFFFDKFTERMVYMAKNRTPENIIGKSIAFEIDGMATISGPPYRPNEYGYMTPTSKRARFYSL